MSDFDMPKDGGFVKRGGWVAYHLAIDFNSTIIRTSGISGNLGFESGEFVKLHEIGQPAGRGGYGWAQWTASRREAFMAFCSEHGLDWRSDEANYGYLCHDLDGDYNRCLDALDGCNTLEEAVFSFGQTFERPGGTTPDHLPGNSGRLREARLAFTGAQALLKRGQSADVPLGPVEAPEQKLHGLSFLGGLRAKLGL